MGHLPYGRTAQDCVFSSDVFPEAMMSDSVRRILSALLLLPCLGTFALAEGPQPSRFRNMVFFSGVDLSTVSEFSWGGLDTSLFNPRDESGPILRMVGGTGRYSYTADGVENGEVNGMVVAGELLGGWRVIRPGLWGAVLAGVEVEEHVLDRIDPDNRIQGRGVGLRVAGEVSWKPGERWRLDASAAYGSAFDLYKARLAGGYVVWREVLAGLEAESFQNTGSDQQRIGVYVEGLRLGRLSFKASAGQLFDDDGTGTYGRLGADINW
jgi:hypothetical protein